jgi:hypothetical protein
LGFPVLRPQTNETLITVLVDAAVLGVMAGIGVAVAAFAEKLLSSRFSPRIEFTAIRRFENGSEILMNLSTTHSEDVIVAFKSLLDALNAGTTSSTGTAEPAANPGPIIFISYRRTDSEGITGRIYDHLCARFGASRVFMDVESILPGLDFREVLKSAVARCDILLAIIGREWLPAEREGSRRLANPDDYVRIEIETALERNIPVVPTLIATAPMPSADALPASLSALVHRQYVRIYPGAEFSAQIAVLADSLLALFRSREN